MDNFSGNFDHDKKVVKKAVNDHLKEIKKSKDFEELALALNRLFEFTHESADYFWPFV